MSAFSGFLLTLLQKFSVNSYNLSAGVILLLFVNDVGLLKYLYFSVMYLWSRLSDALRCGIDGIREILAELIVPLVFWHFGYLLRV